MSKGALSTVTPSIFVSNKFYVRDLELAKLVINDSKNLFLHNHFVLHKSVDVSTFANMLHSVIAYTMPSIVINVVYTKIVMCLMLPCVSKLVVQ